MHEYINGVVAYCDALKAKKKAKKTINLSYDEWNVWFHSQQQDALNKDRDRWTEARHQLEDVYNFEDALVVGSMLMTLQNHSDRVKMACLAQLVNVIAPIMTENGGGSWIQTIFYPFMYGSLYGRGSTLRTIVESDTYLSSANWVIPYLYTSVIDNAEARELTVFAANRSLEEDMELDLCLENFGDFKIIEQIELYSDDLKAFNDKDNARVAPASVALGDMVTLKKHSWNMIRIKY